MKLNAQLSGRRYGPFKYETAHDSIKKFSVAVDAPFPESVVAHPAYVACFNQRPFSMALRDPELNLDFSRLLHAAQRFEFFGDIMPDLEITTEGYIENIHSKGDLEFIVVVSESRSPDGRLLVRGLYSGVVKI